MNGLPKDIKVTMSVYDEFGHSQWTEITLPAGTQIDVIRVSCNGKMLGHLFPEILP